MAPPKVPRVVGGWGRVGGVLPTLNASRLRPPVRSPIRWNASSLTLPLDLSAHSPAENARGSGAIPPSVVVVVAAAAVGRTIGVTDAVVDDANQLRVAPVSCQDAGLGSRGSERLRFSPPSLRDGSTCSLLKTAS